MAVNGARSLVKTLTELGVDTVFGLPGAHNFPIRDALAERGPEGLRVIGVRQEQAAVHAADGYSRTTGSLGVALVTTGPGAVNTVRAVEEARASASPVLVITTDVSSASRAARESECREEFLEPWAKAVLTVEHPDEIAPVVRRAAETALRPRSGPVYVGVPAGFLDDPVTESSDSVGSVGSGPPPVAEEALKEAREALEQAQHPLIWAGGGALRSGAGEAIGLLAERLAAPIVTTVAARGIVPPDHPCLASNPLHAPEVGVLWDEADVVLAIGTDFDDTMTQNGSMPRPPGLIAVNIDAEEAEKNCPPDLLLLGDAREVVEELSRGVSPKPGLDELTRRLDEIEVLLRRRVRKEEPHAAEFLSALKETLPEDSVLVADMCAAGSWIGGFHRVSGPRQLALPMGWGTTGFGFPASLGVAAAGAVRAVCVTGDGGFLPGCSELATAIQEQLPVTVVIVDDGGYGMLSYDRAHAGFEHHGVELATPDFVGLAKSFGVYADRVDGFGRAFRRLLREFTRSDEPNVLVVNGELRPPLNTSSRWYRQENTG
ncbi:thiamine pyrophosphate-binding protein [Saccharomonospora glauca]|uniref:Thiamine pyrophosphate-dependent enzyme, possible carboligase or decarboxylase n=1 Tax=Saccharomonospora glauca K62 TaxID=928724 RepID=I1D5L7_9PSEU|nr:thiamine pyrophosphate-binding protein [Saccharomonospora glauca]EIF00242.1 thiamine pyrophosphate-dependent enzyme, possible carboligase or decarboxylase [Saccharomonospora glauca K62]